MNRIFKYNLEQIVIPIFKSLITFTTLPVRNFNFNESKMC